MPGIFGARACVVRGGGRSDDAYLRAALNAGATVFTEAGTREQEDARSEQVIVERSCEAIQTDEILLLLHRVSPPEETPAYTRVPKGPRSRQGGRVAPTGEGSKNWRLVPPDDGRSNAFY